MAKETKEEKTAEKSFAISPFRNEDAEGIVDLFHTVYGEHYPIRLFYDSQAIAQANEEGRYYSIVARTMDGRVIGVEHLYRSAPGPSIYEAGVGLVDGGYRNLGVNMELLGYLYDTFIPERKNIEEVFGEAVCNHLFMQKTVEKYRHVETAIEVSLMPAAAYDKEKSAAGRVATLAVFRCYQPKPHRIYLPASYERELRTLYGRLDDLRDIAVSTAKAPGDRRSRAELAIFDFAQVARITVPEVGSDFEEVFYRNREGGHLPESRGYSGLGQSHSALGRRGGRGAAKEGLFFRRGFAALVRRGRVPDAETPLPSLF